MRRIIDKPASTREVYMWNMMGSLTNALCSMVFLLIVSRTLPNKQSDIFSIGFAIAQLMYTVATFQMRVFQATDVKEEFSFGQYFSFRLLTSAIMIVTMFVYIVINGYTDYKAIIIVLLCLYKMIDAIADVFEGLYQQRERLDLAGKFTTYRVVPVLIIFAIISIVCRNLLYSSITIVVTCFIVFCIFALRHTGQFLRDESRIIDMNLKTFMSMMTRVLPIFFGGFILMYVFNVPKNSIDSAITAGNLEDGSQTIYNIIFMPASVINLMFIFFRPQITRMAIYFSEEKYSRVIKTAGKIGAILAGFTVFVALAGGTIGVPILGIIFGRDLAPVRWAFIIVLIGGGISALATLMDNLLTIYRKQYLNLIGYGVSLVFALVMGEKMVSRYGLLGASITYTVSMSVLFIVLVIVYCLIESKLKGRKL